MNSTKSFAVFGFMIALCIVFLNFTPAGLQVRNNYFYKINKVDEVSNYENIKKVEDTARAMIVSYSSDKMRYEQYKDSEDSEKKNWGEQAKMRANQTAFQYNEFIRKNSFLWKDNVPKDIDMELEIIN